MNKYDYLESKFPEADFEDGLIGYDELYDGIAQAYEDGFKTAVEKACEYAEAKYDLDYCGNVKDVLDYLKSLVEE